MVGLKVRVRNAKWNESLPLLVSECGGSTNTRATLATEFGLLLANRGSKQVADCSTLVANTWRAIRGVSVMNGRIISLAVKATRVVISG